MASRPVWLRNIRIKILSLALAVISWYAIRDATSFEVLIRDIRIEPQTKVGMAILNQSATTVDVTFRGSQEDIRQIDASQMKAVIDLRGDSPGTEEIAIGPRNVEGVRGVRPVQINPSKVRVTLDVEEEKTVLVRGTSVGKPLLGQVESVVCDPAAVKLYGPARKLATTEFVYTAPVDVDGRIESFAKRSPVLPPSDTWGARVEPPDVQVKVAIVEKASEREFRGIPVMAVMSPGVAAQVDIRPPKVNVVLYGRAEMLESVKEETLKAFVDGSGLHVPGEYDVSVNVHLPTETEVSSATDPELVHVMLK